MIPDWVGLMFGGATAGLGFVLGRIFPRPQLTPEIIQERMKRIVNIEDIEEHEKLVKLRMRRNKLRSVRVDGGPNAIVMPMRVRSRPRRGARKDGR